RPRSPRPPWKLSVAPTGIRFMPMSAAKGTARGCPGPDPGILCSLPGETNLPTGAAGAWPFSPGEESGLSYVEAARQLGMAEGTLKSDVHRFKQRYRQILRAEIAHTVARPEDVDEELRHLLAVLGG